LAYVQDGNVKKTVEVNQVLCKGCGSCMATCPKKGIYVAGFTLDQLEAQVDATLGPLTPLSLTSPGAGGTIALSREVAGKKFVWDGANYVTRDDARQAMETYQTDGFEVHLFLEEDKYLIYTRKLVTQASSAN
jgi:ferredoxin